MSKRSWLLRSLAGFVLFLLSVIVFVMTPWGTQVALSSAEYFVDGLSIERKSGGLGTTLELESVKFIQPNIDVLVKDTQLNIGWSCLFKINVCVEWFSIDKVTANITSSDEPPPPPKEPLSELITLPIGFELAKLDLGELVLALDDSLKVSVKSVATKLNFTQRLAIEHFTIDSIVVESSAEPEKPAPKEPFDPSDIANWQYQPIELPEVYIPIALNLQGFLLKQMSYSTPEATQKLSDIRLAVAASGHNVEVTNLGLKYQQLQLKTKLKAELLGAYPHDLRTTIDGKVENKLIALKITSTGSIEDLNLDVTQQGIGKFELSAKANLLDKQLPLILDAQWQNIAWPLNQPEFSSPSGNLNLSGNLDLLELESAIKAEISGQPSVSLETLIKTDRKVLTVDKLDAQLLGGSIRNSGSLNLSKTINWQGQTTLEQINPGEHWQQLNALVNGKMLTEATLTDRNWRVSLSQLDLDGEWRDLPLRATGKATYGSESGAKLEQISLINGANSLLLDATIDLQNSIVATFNLTADAIEDTVPDVEGKVQLSADIKGQLEQPIINFELAAESLKAQNISVAAISGNGEVNLNEQKKANISLLLSGLQQAENKVDEIALTLSGDADYHELEIKLDSPVSRFNTKLDGKLSEHSWKGNWTSGIVEFEQFSMRMVEKSTLFADWQDQHYELSESCWKTDRDDQQVVSNSSVCISQARFLEEKAQWDMSIDNLPLISLAKLYVPLLDPLEDNLRLNANSTGSWTETKGVNADLIADIRPSGKDKRDINKTVIVIGELSLNGKVRGPVSNINAQLIGPEIGKTSIDAQLDMLDPDGKIQGSAVIERFDVAALKPMASKIETLAGLINGNVELSGLLSNPDIEGKLTLTKGALSADGLPVELSQLEQSIDISNSAANFAGSFLLGGGPGKLTGDIRWSPELVGQIHLQGEGLEIDHQNMIRAKISPDLNVSFSPQDLNISGKVVVPYARIKVRELPPSAISPSSDTQIIEKTEPEEQLKLSLDVLVQIDPAAADNVKVDAFGLISDLAGDLRITQEKKSLLGNGEVRLVNGKYKAYGQDLVIREGDILFNGPVEHPYLSVEAIRNPKQTEDDVIAGIRITGPAEQPKIEIFSEPALEQHEALSYLLQGHATSSSSGGSGEDNMLANLLLGISLGKSENLVSNVGKKLGVEDLALNTTGSGDETLLQVSGYVAPGVQIRYGVGVFDSASEVALRYQIWPNFFVEGVSYGVDNALDFFYSFTLGNKISDTENTNSED
jgi:translocation and assembly module TamB